MAVMLPRLLGAVVGLVVAGIGATAQATTVLFDGPDGGAGGCAMTCLRSQQIYSGSLFSDPVNITKIEFFNPSGGWSYITTWELSLSTSPNSVTEISYLYDANIGADLAVFDTISYQNAVFNGSGTIPFEGSFFYDPNLGDLLVDIIFTGDEISPGAVFEVFQSEGPTAIVSTNSSGGWTGGGGNVARFTFDPVVVAPVPLPAAFPLFATALAGMGLLGWRRKRKASV